MTIENRPLARALYDQVDIDQAVPEEFFKVIAEILAYVYKTKQKYSEFQIQKERKQHVNKRFIGFNKCCPHCGNAGDSIPSMVVKYFDHH